MAEGFPYQLCSADEPLLQIQGPLNHASWVFWLKTHPDRKYVDSLTLIIDRGARIGLEGPHTFITSPAHSSASEAPDILDQDLQKQLYHNRLTFVPSPPQPHAQRYRMVRPVVVVLPG